MKSEDNRAESDKASKYILLFSSNAEKEYLLDAIETVSLPRLGVQHYRYQLQWVDPMLASALPIQGTQKQEDLTDQPVLIAYLYQEVKYETQEKQRIAEWKWKAAYPLRRGTLVDAYKTGNRREDIAHFYFKLEGYVDYDAKLAENFFVGVLQQLGGERYYSMYATVPGLRIATQESDASAVNAIASAIKKEDLKTPDVDSQRPYYPMFLRLNDLRYWKGGAFVKVSPEYDAGTHTWYYPLTESSRYILDSSYLFLAAPSPASKISLDAGPGLSVFRESVNVASRYDEYATQINTGATAQESWSSLVIKTDFESRNEVEESLNLTIPVQLLIKPKTLWRRLLSEARALKDILLVVGTASITIWAVTKEGLLLDLAAVIYAGWILSTVVLAFEK